MLETPHVDPRFEAPLDAPPPIGCWITGLTAEEIVDTQWDDDFLLIGAQLRPAFGALVSLDEERPAYVVELAHADVEVTIQRTGPNAVRANVVCRARARDTRESVVAIPIEDADPVRLPEAVLDASRKARDIHSTLHPTPTT
jgi:hypothetical protein